MNTIKPDFTRGGFRHRQLKRAGDVAIFLRSKGTASHYEVVRIRAHKGFKIGGVDVPPGEQYPSAEEFGTHGWTFTTETDANAKFDHLTK